MSDRVTLRAVSRPGLRRGDTRKSTINQTPARLQARGDQRPIMPGRDLSIISKSVLAPRKVGHVLEVSVAVRAVVPFLEGVDDELLGCWAGD